MQTIYIHKQCHKILLMIWYISSISIIESAASTTDKIAIKYAQIIAINTAYKNSINTPPNIINPINTDQLSYPLQTKTISPIHDYIKNSIITSNDNLLTEILNFQSINEYIISDNILTEKDIEFFKNKFHNETEIFIKKLSNFWTLFKNKYDEITTHHHETDKIERVSISANQINISRDEAFTSIEKITEQIFDPQDHRPLSTYIAEIKNLSTYLDPIQDKIIIDAIDFLYQNQHKNSIWDTLFWKNAVQEKKLNQIPKSSKLKPIPATTMISTAMNKAKLQAPQ